MRASLVDAEPTIDIGGIGGIDLSDALHRQMAAGSSRCWILVDRSARALGECAELLQALTTAPSITLSSHHADLDASLLPVLLGIDTTQASGSEALRSSLSASAQELTPSTLANGNGRAICAWVRCDEAFNDDSARRRLAGHLSRQSVQRKPDGTSTLLRWYDPAVLWVLWSLLRPQQQASLLGPVRELWLLDPAGGLVRLSNRGGIAPLESLGLSAEQWEDVDHIGAMNLALIGAAGRGDHLPPLKATPGIALKALRRARALGFADTNDLAAFAERALSVHPEFDTHPQVHERLAKRQSGDYFTALVDDMTPAAWQVVLTECRASVAS